ncbi:MULTISPECIES: DUF1488 domain-containing protein [unclassified Rhizobium]|uniref:DUF1488 domain-containing protein n=1 Tax=unclassified Rhizobium TaxID=2613769 RepID=UPI0006F77B16|nr:MULTISPECIES: DUF1488 domain-containing protein [unclassified Rhizobium]KQV35070.1 hypothetical protein ASC86_12675 [Rhizobium sp. Root1212]KRD24875.1 hypothetical protein ASE37_12670 [Rhizobium sp. Root268]
MTLSFPNAARSYDETHMRVRFTGYDGMFEIKCFLSVDVFSGELSPRNATEKAYLAAFDDMRAQILETARRVYKSRPQATILLDRSHFH